MNLSAACGCKYLLNDTGLSKQDTSHLSCILYQFQETHAQLNEHRHRRLQ